MHYVAWKLCSKAVEKRSVALTSNRGSKIKTQKEEDSNELYNSYLDIPNPSYLSKMIKLKIPNMNFHVNTLFL